MLRAGTIQEIVTLDTPHRTVFIRALERQAELQLYLSQLPEVREARLLADQSVQVEIIGSTSTTTGSGSTAVTNSATFICVTTAGPGTFTVPASILGQMYATTAASPGLLEVASGNFLATFTATLKADGSSIPGVFGSFLGIGSTPVYQ